jgi:hypothetical protein
VGKAMAIELRPADLFEDKPSNPSNHLIILNSPIENFEAFRRVWNNSDYRICADGGANRLHDLFKTPRQKRKGEFWRRDDFVRILVWIDLERRVHVKAMIGA